MDQRILFITPPFTQLSTPYPATAYLTGYLNTLNFPSHQMDLGIETILALFSHQGLSQLFDQKISSIESYSQNAKRILRLKDSYIKTIDSVINFLQNQDSTLAHLICSRHFLPEASKFEQVEDLEWAFGTMGIQDKARHLATLYLEDIGDYIAEVVDPHFGFSRYAERLAMSSSSFDELYMELSEPANFISELYLSILKNKITEVNPTVLCFSVPFPGNLFAALKCGQWTKNHYPNINIAMGGGYPNTELRSLADPRVFEFVDFITLDDGETPLVTLLSYLDESIKPDMLKRTLILDHEQVTYSNNSIQPDVRQEHVGTPDYTGLPLRKYLSVIQLTNPMHRLWSDGRWNKLTMAHGCYWGKCTFCDISLDYIKNYESNSAITIVDRMATLVQQTGERGFHFVDEAAPPALMKAVAIEILKRGLVFSWWANIRFEKSFHLDLCRLLASSGCIAVSGGLEVASDRLLKLIDKGVTVEQVTRVNDNFNQAGIMVHAYLMYGFPTQSDQETIDSLEVVRQMFAEGVMQSAFWHRFAMTAHSPVGINPEKFKVQALADGPGEFANNDLEHIDPTGGDHGAFSKGLKTSLYNYMHGVCLDDPLQNWFDHDVPDTTVKSNLISSFLQFPLKVAPKDNHQIIWVGGPLHYEIEQQTLHILSNQTTHKISCTEQEGLWLVEFITSCGVEQCNSVTYSDLKNAYNANKLPDFTLYWYGQVMEELKRIGLLVV